MIKPTVIIAALFAGQVIAQYPLPPEGLVEIQSKVLRDVTISYKKVPVGTQLNLPNHIKRG